MSFNTLVKRQYQLKEEIQQFIENCRKSPLERRTSQFYDTKIKNLQQLGEELHRNHGEIVRQDDIDQNDEYFQTTLYEKVQTMVTEFVKKLETKAMELARDNATKKDDQGGAKDNLGEQHSPDARLRYNNVRRVLRNQKALMTAITRLIEDIMSQRNAEHPPSYYHVTATILEQHMIEFAKNNTELWEFTDDDQIEEYTLNTFYDVEEKARGAMIELQRHMSDDGHRQGNQNDVKSNDKSLKLPKITLPTFNGDYLHWEAFKDLYTEMVHKAPISDSQRIHYLTQALTDEPKNLIKHLPATGNNYGAAWEILTNRYDNKRLIVSTLLNKLFSQQAIKSDSPSTIKALHDVTSECIHGLTTQGLPVDQWDAIISHLLIKKMDQPTQTVFEQGINDNKRLISQKEVLKFLERRFQSLEVRGITERSAKRIQTSNNKNEPSTTRTCASATKGEGGSESCLVCKGPCHKLYACKTFTNADLNQKWKWVKDLKLCVNCLRPGHQAEACKSGTCTKCPKKHNTLMHNDNANKTNKRANGSAPQNNRTSQPSSTTTDTTSTEQSSSKVSLLANSEDNYVLLGTAKIQLAASNGKWVDCRAVLDSGSQVNLITEKLMKKLGGTSRQIPMSVEGVGNNQTKIRHRATIKLQSLITDFITELEAHIMPKIVSDQPVRHLNISSWGIPQDLTLADPEFYKPGKIDCLLGAEVFFDLLRDGHIKLADNLPVLKNSALGWIVGGPVDNSTTTKAICGICTTKELEEAVSQFWESDEISDSESHFSEENLQCESHFLQHTKHSSDGRLVVRLPLRDHPSKLSESKTIAYQRFQSLERRFKANPELKMQYISFIREYQSLGHMTPIDETEIPSVHYYIPHHCVLRPHSTSTKLRVVFDASAHKSTGLSLNDLMYTGPTVQAELFSILLRFRMYRYVMKTDVEKMYRQIWVHPDDRHLQLILWRESPTEPLKTMQLNTVTYGTRSAPYLATRCLNLLADENMARFSLGASSLRTNFYVDDGLVGADSLWEALEIQNQLITILGSAGMKLKKWSANHPKLLRGIPPEDQEINLDFQSEEKQSTTTLGIQWLPKTDVFSIKVTIQGSERMTKRTVSSELAHIYDPLGLIGPVLVTGKIQLQLLWKLKIDWDADLPPEIQRKWLKYREELATLNSITFPRHVLSAPCNANSVQLHAFADASEKAFGAAIYVRTLQKDKTVKLNLLCSRSRVAPTKTQTIPRLELCAALLAAELMARVKQDIDYKDKPAYYWTDSTIVLSWIHNHPGKLPAYVAHRIVKIHQVTIPDQWRHVASKQNPADVLSRGIMPRDFPSCHIWFYGPMFLFHQESFWPAPFKMESENDDTTTTAAVITQKQAVEPQWVYSIPSQNSFTFVQRVVGYIQRFIRNTRRSKDSRPKHLNLSAQELDLALKLIIQQIQSSEFYDIKRILIKERFVPKTNNLSSLTPFLDEEGIIRVGGRLSSSTQKYDANHQMILPSNDPLVKLLILRTHKTYYHVGPQALLAQVRQRFWPLGGKSLTRSIVQKCVTCRRARPTLYSQIMGNLPRHRVQPARPFLNSGVDYCGPFFVHYKVRGKRPQKAYIAVFCCFSTKAVHLELVTDLTTEAFIGALKRFIARRGRCKELYCDNATNFVGAKNQLQEINEILYSKSAQEKIIKACSDKEITFNFIPPRSPHFGGLWEAAVKSAKHLMLKNVSTASLTYEELETVVVEIESILNSRPLIPSSSDASDFNAITPAHFLIGEELTSSVDAQATDRKLTLLQRWQLVSELKRIFWQRWSTEYLNELQQRHKWKASVHNIEPNTMVIIKEDNLPILKWPLGRIVKVYKGDDGIVRVCDVKTQKGIFKRAIHRLAPLLPEEEAAADHDSNQNSPQETNLVSPDENKISSLKVSIPLNRIKNIPPAPDAVPVKRARLHPTLLLTILALLMLPIALCSPINITNFDKRPGVYFERLGNVKLITTTWNMVVYFDLAPLQQEMDLIADGTSTLQKLCDNHSTDSPCAFLLNYFDHTLLELQTKLSMLSQKRSKRGAVDVIGNVANSLFGILDSNYATKMSETIDGLKGNDAHLEMLMKNQTSLIDSTINIIKENELSTQAKFDEIDSRIHDLLYGSNPLNEMQISQNILNLSIQMFIMVSNLLWTHSSIMDVLIDSHHGRLNPILLTPHQLNEEILKIRAHLPPNLQLSIHQDNLIEAYKLLKISGEVARKHVVFNIELPLTDPREFELLHLIPIETEINGSLSAAKLSTKYLAISPHKDEFVSMSQHQLDACISFSYNEMLCQNEATFHKASTANKCELDLLNNQDHPRCEFYKLDDTTTWHRLKRLNYWIYATINPIKLHAVCTDDSVQVELKASGLIQLQPDCTLKTDELTIKGHTQIVSTLHSIPTKLTMPLGWSKLYTPKNINSTLFKPNIHELNIIQKKLARIEESSLPYEIKANQKHSLIVGYTAITLIIIASIIASAIMLWKRRMQGKKVTLKPVPAPRIQSIAEGTEC